MAMGNVITRSNSAGYPSEGKGQKGAARKREKNGKRDTHKTTLRSNEKEAEAKEGFSPRNIKARLKEKRVGVKERKGEVQRGRASACPHQPPSPCPITSDQPSGIAASRESNNGSASGRVSA